MLGSHSSYNQVNPGSDSRDSALRTQLLSLRRLQSLFTSYYPPLPSEEGSMVLPFARASSISLAHYRQRLPTPVIFGSHAAPGSWLAISLVQPCEGKRRLGETEELHRLAGLRIKYVLSPVTAHGSIFAALDLARDKLRVRPYKRSQN